MALDRGTIIYIYIRLHLGEYPVIKEVLQEHPLGNQSLFVKDLGVLYKPLVKFLDPDSGFYECHGPFQVTIRFKGVVETIQFISGRFSR